MYECKPRKGVWERLDAKFPINGIPRAILQDLKETKPMSSASAREMRRVLEQIKDFARHSKHAERTEELASQTTLDLIEQKLSNNLVRSFRRWVNKEHKDKPVTVDLLIVFLQDETELEERLQIKTQLPTKKQKTLPSINCILILVIFVNYANNFTTGLSFALYS